MSAPPTELLPWLPVTALRPGDVILDVRPGPDGRAAYEAERIANAKYVDLDRHLSAAVADPSKGGRHPLPDPREFAKRAATWGIGPDEGRVVVYDAKTNGNSARAWWMLRAIGHRATFMLDGGMEAAREAKVDMERGRPREQTVPIARAYAPNAWLLPTMTIDAVPAFLDDSNATLLDARARHRFRGEHEAIDPIAGHIPGAKNAPFEELHLDKRGRFKSLDELREIYRGILGTELGGSSSKLAAYCGSGVTACHSVAVLSALGVEASLYVGSFGEWCRAGREVATGE